MAGLGGFNPADFEQKLAAYETWARLKDPAFGRAVTDMIDRYYRIPKAQLQFGMGGFRGLGDGATTSFADITAVDVTPLDITPPDPGNLFDTFTPAGSGPDEIVITATPTPSPTEGPITVDPWFTGTPVTPDFTAADITPPNYDAISQAFQNFVPATSSTLTDAAKKVAAGIGALAAKAASALGGGAGGQAASGAAQLKQAAGTPAKPSTSTLWIVLAAVAAGWAVLEALSN